jgi:hypothetical protein
MQCRVADCGITQASTRNNHFIFEFIPPKWYRAHGRRRLVAMNFSKRLWRRLSACIALYAFVLHAMLLAFAPFPAAAGTALGRSVTGFEICLHDGAEGAGPAVPSGHSGTDNHCPFCVADGHSSVAALPRTHLPLIVAYLSTLRWVVASDEVVETPASFSAQPRGPPRQA